MNDEPINHVCRALGRPERIRDVDLEKSERSGGGRRNTGKAGGFQCS